MSRQDEFRLGVRDLLSHIERHLQEQRDQFPVFPPRDDEGARRAEVWITEVGETFSLYFRDAGCLLDEVPVKPPELRQIRDEILKIPIVRCWLTAQSATARTPSLPAERPLTCRDYNQWLPVLASRLREMLEYLPRPHTSPANTAKELRMRGPKADMRKHTEIANVVAPFGDDWKQDDNLEEIAKQLDQKKIPVSPSWHNRQPTNARTWKTALMYFSPRVVKAIEYSLKMASRNNQPSED